MSFLFQSLGLCALRVLLAVSIARGARIDEDDDEDERLPLDLVGNARLIQNLDMGASERGVSTDPFASLTDFRSYYGLAPDGSNDAEDWSGFGVPNLLYIAFGIADKMGAYPDEADAYSLTPGLPSISVSDEPHAFRLTYSKSLDAALDLTFSIQRRDRTENWQDAPKTATLVLASRDDGENEYTVASLPLDEVRQFILRLVVSVSNE